VNRLIRKAAKPFRSPREFMVISRGGRISPPARTEGRNLLHKIKRFLGLAAVLIASAAHSQTQPVAVRIVGSGSRGVSTTDGSLNVSMQDPLGAFGEMLTVTKAPTIQNLFTYGASTEAWRYFINGGGSTATANSMVEAVSGTSSTSSLVSIGTLRDVVYRPGQGAEVVYAVKFDTGQAGTIQFAGVGNGETALGFVYDYDGIFKVVRSSGGLRDLRVLNVDAKSSNSQNVTITLANQTFTCAVTNGATIDVTAAEIGRCDYTTKYPGWVTSVQGSSITFIPSLSGTLPGDTFSASFPTSGSGTFFQRVAPKTPAVESVQKSQWNLDVMDGTASTSNPSGALLDPTKLNVYRIAFQFLGAGAITFGVESPDSGKIIPVHRIKYAGRESTPSLTNPSMPFIISARNIGFAGNVSLKMSSVAGFDQGEVRRLGQQRSYSVTKTGVGTSFVPILTIDNARLRGDGSTINQQKAIMINLSMSNTGTKGLEFQMIQNANLSTDRSLVYLSTGTSPMRVDSVASSYSGGIPVIERGAPAGTPRDIDLSPYLLIVPPGGRFTVVARSVATTTDVSASVQWVEDF